METICETGKIIGGRRTLLPETNVNLFVNVAGGSKSMKIIHENECNSSSSSSIGEDSDGDLQDDDVAESSYYNYNYDHYNDYNDNDDHNNYNGKINNDNGSFDDAIQALEQALPMRRGISTYYNGKSKSFTSLNVVSLSPTSSIQDIAKPENAYTRKRKNLSAFNLSSVNTGENGISKKPKTTMLHFTSERNNPTFNKQATQSQVNRSFPLRSFSMVNLLRCNPTKIGNC
ncbi:protein OXIDATIVE STRESS 3 LIKE 2-like [Rutidosis leptorrhynchoides]|uniref:protein OXIDATIVE STRESS 3 LIKE 2-like n=1 Tax=Rutidosis leptorrhynchoides TaxID=125765 RepID=UPI003A99FB99